MKNQTKALVIVTATVAIAARVFAGAPPQAQEETYKRVSAKIAQREAYERYVKRASSGH